MNGLTINRIAGAGLRADKRGYRSLILGILLSVFMVSAICLCVHGIYLKQRELIVMTWGYADCYVLGDGADTDDMRASGVFDDIGEIYLLGSIADGEIYVGKYDNTANKLMNRRLAQGRLPEKPGELAIELSALTRINADLSVGDTLTLNITPIEGEIEAREFTLVGVMHDQASLINASEHSGAAHMPALITCEAEMEFGTGRALKRRACTLAMFTKLNEAFDYANARFHQGVQIVGVSAEGLIYHAEQTKSMSLETEQALTLVMLLGGALVLSACVGISSALDAQLARKTEQIGMLRAVGATRRQIRRIFGREAWLITLITSPPAILLSCLAVWLISIAAPSTLMFKPSPILLAPVLIFSMLCVLISSYLPLTRAARVMPMNVIRDSMSARRSGAVKSRARFRAHRLIALRQNMYHPARPLGAALLVALMLISAILLTVGAVFVYDKRNEMMPDYALSGGARGDGTFFEDMTLKTITDGDIESITALDSVYGAQVVRRARVNLILDEMPEFYKQSSHMQKAYMLTEAEYRTNTAASLSEYTLGKYYAVSEDIIDTEYWRLAQAEHDAARDAMGVDRAKILLGHELIVMDIDTEALAPYIREGAIDLEALDAGREVLAYTPDLYIARVGNRITNFNYPPVGFSNYTHVANNTLSAGQQMHMIQAYTDTKDNLPIALQGEEYSFWYPAYARMSKRETEAYVGAVLEHGALKAALSPYEVGACLITTPKGAQAMGLNVQNLYLANVRLMNNTDINEETQVTELIETIAQKCDNVHLYNYLDITREEARYARRLFAVLAAIIILFFAVAVSVISGGVTRRIRADARMIGTLRAVGADAKVIAGCYRAQIVLSVLLGLIAGFVATLFMWKLTKFGLPRAAATLAPLSALAFSGLNLLVCLIILRARVAEVMRVSIVDNIREL